MATERDEIDLDMGDDDFDRFLNDDSDWGDFDDLTDGSENNKKSRKPIDALKDALGEGFKDNQNKEAYIEEAKKQLPGKFSVVYDDAETYIRTGQELFEESHREIKQSVNKFKTNANRLVKAYDRILPGPLSKLLDKLTKTEQEDREEQYRRQEESNEQRIAGEIGQFTAAQLELQRLAESREILRDKQEEKRFESQQELLYNISTGIQRQVAQEEQIAFKQRNKLIEIGYHQLYTQRAIQKSLLDSSNHTKQALDSIVKNTSLPDIVKSKNMEIMKDMFLRRTMEKVGGKMTTYLSGFKDNLIQNATNIINDKVKNVTGGLDMVSDAAGMMTDAKEMMDGFEAPKSRSEIAANWTGALLSKLVTSKATNSVINRLDKTGKLSGLIEGSHRNVRHMGTYLNNWKAENAGKDGLTGLLASLIPATAEESLSHDLSARYNLTKQAEFDNATRRSIVDVIPQLLAKIHQSTEGIRYTINPDSGPLDDSQLLEWDNDTATLNTRKRIDQKTYSKLYKLTKQDSQYAYAIKLVNLIDSDNILEEKTKREFAKEIMGTLGERRGFRPMRFLDPNYKWKFNFNEEEKDKILTLLHDKFDSSYNLDKKTDQYYQRFLSKSEEFYANMETLRGESQDRIYKESLNSDSDVARMRRLNLATFKNGKFEVKNDGFDTINHINHTAKKYDNININHSSFQTDLTDDDQFSLDTSEYAFRNMPGYEDAPDDGLGTINNPRPTEFMYNKQTGKKHERLTYNEWLEYLKQFNKQDNLDKQRLTVPGFFKKSLNIAGDAAGFFNYDLGEKIKRTGNTAVDNIDNGFKSGVNWGTEKFGLNKIGDLVSKVGGGIYDTASAIYYNKQFDIFTQWDTVNTDLLEERAKNRDPIAIHILNMVNEGKSTEEIRAWIETQRKRHVFNDGEKQEDLRNKFHERKNNFWNATTSTMSSTWDDISEGYKTASDKVKEVMEDPQSAVDNVKEKVTEIIEKSAEELKENAEVFKGIVNTVVESEIANSIQDGLDRLVDASGEIIDNASDSKVVKAIVGSAAGKKLYSLMNKKNKISVSYQDKVGLEQYTPDVAGVVDLRSHAFKNQDKRKSIKLLNSLKKFIPATEDSDGNKTAFGNVIDNVSTKVEEASNSELVQNSLKSVNENLEKANKKKEELKDKVTDKSEDIKNAYQEGGLPGAIGVVLGNAFNKGPIVNNVTSSEIAEGLLRQDNGTASNELVKNIASVISSPTQNQIAQQQAVLNEYHASIPEQDKIIVMGPSNTNAFGKSSVVEDTITEDQRERMRREAGIPDDIDTTKVFDVYIEGEEDPRLIFIKIIDGHYRTVETNKQLRSPYDIDSAVQDEKGRTVIELRDVAENRLVTVNGEHFLDDKSIQIANSILNDKIVNQNKTAQQLTKMSSMDLTKKALGIAFKPFEKIHKYFYKAMDVYLRPENNQDEPRLIMTRFGMIRGQYMTKDKTIIDGVDKINGAVYNAKTGEIIATEEEMLRACDSKGRTLSSNYFVRRFRLAKDLIKKTMWSMPKALLKGGIKASLGLMGLLTGEDLIGILRLEKEKKKHKLLKKKNNLKEKFNKLKFWKKDKSVDRSDEYESQERINTLREEQQEFYSKGYLGRTAKTLGKLIPKKLKDKLSFKPKRENGIVIDERTGKARENNYKDEMKRQDEQTKARDAASAANHKAELERRAQNDKKKNPIMDFLMTWFGKIFGMGGLLFSGLKTVLGWAGKRLLTGLGSLLGKMIPGFIKDGLGNAWKATKDLAGKGLEKVGDLAKSGWDKIKKGATALKDGLKSGSIWTKVKDGAGNAWKAVKNSGVGKFIGKHAGKLATKIGIRTVSTGASGPLAPLVGAVMIAWTAWDVLSIAKDIFTSPNKVDDFRIAAYGIDPENSSRASTVLELEEWMVNNTRINSAGTLEIADIMNASKAKDKKLVPIIAKFFGNKESFESLTQDEQDAYIVRFRDWINFRFNPVFYQHAISLYQINKDVKLTNAFGKLGKLKDGLVYPWLRRSYFKANDPENPYGQLYDPFLMNEEDDEDTIKHVGQEVVDKYYNIVVDAYKEDEEELREDEQKRVKNGDGAKGYFEFETKTKRFSKENANNRGLLRSASEDSVKRNVFNKDFSRAKTELIGNTVYLLDPIENVNLDGRSAIDDGDAIRLRMYGLNSLVENRVKTLLSLEKEMMNYITFSNGNASFGKFDLNAIISKYAPLLNWNIKDEEELGKFKAWFEYRFSPTILAFVNIVNRRYGTKDILNFINSDKISSTDKYEIYMELIGTKTFYEGNEYHIWDIPFQVINGLDVNKSSGSITGNILNLERGINYKVLTERDPNGLGDKKEPNSAPNYKSLNNGTSNNLPIPKPGLPEATIDPKFNTNIGNNFPIASSSGIGGTVLNATTGALNAVTNIANTVNSANNNNNSITGLNKSAPLPINVAEKIVEIPYSDGKKVKITKKGMYLFSKATPELIALGKQYVRHTGGGTKLDGMVPEWLAMFYAAVGDYVKSTGDKSIFNVTSAFRTKADQERIRKQNNNSKYVAKISAHEFGIAMDITNTNRNVGKTAEGFKIGLLTRFEEWGSMKKWGFYRRMRPGKTRVYEDWHVENVYFVTIGRVSPGQDMTEAYSENGIDLSQITSNINTVNNNQNPSDVRNNGITGNNIPNISNTSNTQGQGNLQSSNYTTSINGFGGGQTGNGDAGGNWTNGNVSNNISIGEDKYKVSKKPDKVKLAKMLIAKINQMGWSENEKAHFLSQVTHETGGLQWLTEYASGKAYDITNNPEKANELGNTSPGDGPKYKGRGLIQLTGKANYQSLANRIGRPEIVNNPQLIAEDPELAITSAIDFWEEKKKTSKAFRHSVHGDSPRDIRAVRVGVNGRAAKGIEETRTQFHVYKKGQGVITKMAGEVSNIAGNTPSIETNNNTDSSINNTNNVTPTTPTNVPDKPVVSNTTTPSSTSSESDTDTRLRLLSGFEQLETTKTETYSGSVGGFKEYDWNKPQDNNYAKIKQATYATSEAPQAKTSGSHSVLESANNAEASMNINPANAQAKTVTVPGNPMHKVTITKKGMAILAKATPELVNLGKQYIRFTGNGKLIQGMIPEFMLLFYAAVGDYVKSTSDKTIFEVYSSFRSHEKQKQLYADAMRKNGGKPSKFVARPGGSMHEFGIAMDITNTGRPGKSGKVAKAFTGGLLTRWEKWGSKEKWGFYRRLRPGMNTIEDWHVENVHFLKNGKAAPGQTADGDISGNNAPPVDNKNSSSSTSTPSATSNNASFGGGQTGGGGAGGNWNEVKDTSNPNNPTGLNPLTDTQKSQITAENVVGRSVALSGQTLGSYTDANNQSSIVNDVQSQLNNQDPTIPRSSELPTDKLMQYQNKVTETQQQKLMDIQKTQSDNITNILSEQLTVQKSMDGNILKILEFIKTNNIKDNTDKSIEGEKGNALQFNDRLNRPTNKNPDPAVRMNIGPTMRA